MYFKKYFFIRLVSTSLKSMISIMFLSVINNWFDTSSSNLLCYHKQSSKIKVLILWMWKTRRPDCACECWRKRKVPRMDVTTNKNMPTVGAWQMSRIFCWVKESLFKCPTHMLMLIYLYIVQKKSKCLTFSLF